MKRYKSKTVIKNRVVISLMILAFLFSIFKVGKSFAAADSFKIVSAEITEKSEGAEVNSLSFEGTKITNDITFNNVGDSVTYKVVVKNNDKISYVIKSISDDNTNEYITYSYDGYEGVVISGNGETTFNITATYSKELTDVSKRDQTSTVNISFALEDEAKGLKTGDTIAIYTLATIASFGMILIILKRNSKSHTKGKHDKGIKLFSLLLVVAVILPTMSKAVSNKLVLTFENTYRLYSIPSNIKILVENEDEWKPSKQVTINYEMNSDGFINQYSLDDGTTWETYTGPITLNENNIKVKARTIAKDTEEVIDSTEKKVTKIDPTVPTIALALGDRYYSGQELDLASITTTTYGESGATVTWTIEGVEVTNLSETTKIDKMDSEYQTQVIATITTGAGLTATVTSPTIIIQYALWNDFLIDGVVTRDNIQSMKFGSWAERPTNPTGSKDISYNDTDVVFEYYTLDPETNLYDIYITSPYGYTRYYNDDMRIYVANDQDLVYLSNNETDRTRGLFSYIPNMKTIDFEYLDMYNITNTAHLFDNIDYTSYYWDCDSSLESITWGNKFNTVNVTDMACMFAGLNKLESIDLEKFDLTSTKNIQGMFAMCESLDTIEVSSWDTKNVEYYADIFYATTSLENLDVSNWNTSSAKELHQVFYKSGIGSLDLSKWDTTNVTNMEGMFETTPNLTYLDVSTWNTENVTDMSYMFYKCALEDIDLSSFNTQKVTDIDLMFCYGSAKTIDFKNLDLPNLVTAEFMFSCMSNLQNVYVKATPTYKAGSNRNYMWYNSRINNYTIKDYGD